MYIVKFVIFKLNHKINEMKKILKLKIYIFVSPFT